MGRGALCSSAVWGQHVTSADAGDHCLSVWEVWMTPVRLTKIIRVEIFPLFCWLWWQFVVIWSETEAGDDSGQGEGQSQVMTTSRVTCHASQAPMQNVNATQTPCSHPPQSRAPINNWGTLLNSSSTYLITFTSSEIILETPPRKNAQTHRESQKIWLWGMKKLFRTERCFLQRFVLNKYSCHFTVKDLLWLFSSIGPHFASRQTEM